MRSESKYNSTGYSQTPDHNFRKKMGKIFFFLFYLFLYHGKVYVTQNLPSQPFLNVQFNGIKYTHIVKLSPESISKNLFILQNYNSIHITAHNT